MLWVPAQAFGFNKLTARVLGTNAYWKLKIISKAATCLHVLIKPMSEGQRKQPQYSTLANGPLIESLESWVFEKQTTANFQFDWSESLL